MFTQSISCYTFMYRLFMGRQNMPITVDWYEEEKRNICYRLIARWSWEDLFTAIDEAVVLLDSVDYPVNLVLDMTNTTHVPTLAVNSLAKVASAPTMTHPNTKQILMFGANKYIELMMNIFKKFFPNAGQRYIICKNTEELDSYLSELEEKRE